MAASMAAKSQRRRIGGVTSEAARKMRNLAWRSEISIMAYQWRRGGNGVAAAAAAAIKRRMKNVKRRSKNNGAKSNNIIGNQWRQRRNGISGKRKSDIWRLSAKWQRQRQRRISQPAAASK
jgi:hypothetical protein